MTAVYWTSSACCWAVIILALLAVLHYRRRAIAMAARARGAADPDGLENWARWTILSVTDREGNISAWNLRQIYDSRTTDRVFVDPISVALWHSDPVTSQAWQDEVDAMFGKIAGDTPEEHPRG